MLRYKSFFTILQLLQKNPDLIFFKNLKIYEHFHLSDAEGIFGEGVSLGSGGLFKTKLLKHIINQKKKKCSFRDMARPY